MAGFVELQKTLYRSYALVEYGAPNINWLSNEERAALEFKVQVRRGSSEYKLLSDDVLLQLGSKLIEHMDPTHLVITVVSLATLLFGRLAWKDYLQSRTETRREEIQTQEKRDLLEGVQFLSELETERVRILADALGQTDELPQVDEGMDEARREFLKRLPRDSMAIIGDAEVDGEVAHELIKNPRHRSEEILIEDTFRILRVDTTAPDGFRVRLKNLEENLTLTAGVRDIMISEQQRRIIRRAEWAKVPVIAQIQAKRRGQHIVGAVIIEVNRVDEH